MLKDKTLLGGILLLLVGVLVAVGLWVLVLRTPAPAGGPVEAVPVTPAGDATAVAGATIFEIVSAESEARFILGELLRGVDTTVVGATDQIAGQIIVDLDDPATAQVGEIRINARTFFTDNNFRNNAIQNRILFTDQYEFITFTPTDLNGLPDGVTIGDPVSFQITGDLTIRDVTNRETFAVTATAVSPTRLEGSATSTIMRHDYDLRIPTVRNVADVDEEVTLEFDFVAEVSP